MSSANNTSRSPVHGSHDDMHTQDREDARGVADSDDDDLDHSKQGKRKKIEIKFIHERSKRHITFSKRKSGIMKKAYELSVLTGTEVLLLVASETGHIYTFATDKLQPMLSEQSGAPCVSCGYMQNAKHMIQTCLNADVDDVDDDAETTENDTSITKSAGSAATSAVEVRQPPRSPPAHSAHDNAHAGNGTANVARPVYTASQQQVLAAFLLRQRQYEQQQVQQQQLADIYRGPSVSASVSAGVSASVSSVSGGNSARISGSSASTLGTTPARYPDVLSSAGTGGGGVTTASPAALQLEAYQRHLQVVDQQQLLQRQHQHASSAWQPSQQHSPSGGHAAMAQPATSYHSPGLGTVSISVASATGVNTMAMMPLSTASTGNSAKASPARKRNKGKR